MRARVVAGLLLISQTCACPTALHSRCDANRVIPQTHSPGAGGCALVFQGTSRPSRL